MNLKLLKHVTSGSHSHANVPDEWNEFSFHRGQLIRTTQEGTKIVPHPYAR